MAKRTKKKNSEKEKASEEAADKKDVVENNDATSGSSEQELQGIQAQIQQERELLDQLRKEREALEAKKATDEPLVRPATQQEVADLAMTTASVGVARQQHSDHINEARQERQKLGRRKIARGGQMGPQTHTVINKVNNTNHTMMATLPPGSDYDLYEIEFRAGQARVPPIVADKLRKIRNLDVK